MIATAHIETTDSSYFTSFNTETAALPQYTAKPGCQAAAGLYAVHVIWVLEDLFWLAVAVSFDFFFLFTRTYLERLAGCFSSMCRFRFALDVGEVYTKRSHFSHLDHHRLFIQLF